MEQRQDFLEVKELAEALRVPVSWVYEQSRRCKHTGFPVEKYGKYLRFSLQEVREWARKQAHKE